MKSKTHRHIICGILILFCIVLIKVVDVRTPFLLKAAAVILEQTAKIIPHSECTQSLLSWTYYKLNDTDKADKALDQAHINSIKNSIKKNPQDAEAYFYLGQKYHQAGRIEQAIDCYEKAKQIDTNLIWVWESLGEAYIDDEQYDKAIVTYKEGIQNIEHHPMWSTDSKYILNCYLGLEFAYMKLEKIKDAQACREKALKLWPNTADYYYCFGKMFIKKGDWEAAIELYKTSLDFDPNNPDIQNSLDVAYQELKNIEINADPVTQKTLKHERELRQLADHVEQERQRIENEYATDYTKFSTWSQKRIKELDREQEIAYKTFQQQQNAIKAAAAGKMKDPNADQFDNDLMNDTITSVLGDPARQLKLTMTQIEKEKDFIYQEFTRLRETKDRSLRSLEEYERNAKDRIASELRRMEQLKDDETLQHLGMIQSISIGASKGNRVMLGGEFYSEGDTVNGCRIISINEEGIKYAKEGNVYQQSLN